jgi:hypothetical protein
MNLYKVFVPIWYVKNFLSQVTHTIQTFYHKTFSILIQSSYRSNNTKGVFIF